MTLNLFERWIIATINHTIQLFNDLFGRNFYKNHKFQIGDKVIIKSMIHLNAYFKISGINYLTKTYNLSFFVINSFSENELEFYDIDKRRKNKLKQLLDD